jgi:hypothetical protein
MRSGGVKGVAVVVRALAVPAIAAALAGCGGSSHHTGTTAATQNATVRAAPVSDLALVTGPPAQQITETIVAFYRAASQNDAARACSLFSPAGAAGFLRAAKISFPASINQFSTCTKAMEIYNASLTASISQLQQSDPAVSGAALDNVRVASISVRGVTATVLAPVNAEPMINPKLISLVRSGGRWLINGSESLNKSNLPQILAQARAKGLLPMK